MADFKVGDRVLLNDAGRKHLTEHWPGFAPYVDQHAAFEVAEAYASGIRIGQRVKGEWEEGGWFNPEHLEPAEPAEPADAVSAPLTHAEQFMWASTQHAVSQAILAAENAREGVMSAFRETVEQDHPELVGKQWDVVDGRFEVQQ